MLDRPRPLPRLSTCPGVEIESDIRRKRAKVSPDRHRHISGKLLAELLGVQIKHLALARSLLRARTVVGKVFGK